MIEKHAALRERRRTDTASCVRDRYSVHLAAAASAIPYLSCSLAVARHSLELQPSPHHRLLLIMAERPMVRHALSELQHGIRGATAARAQVKSSSSSSDTLLPRSSPTASCVPTSPKRGAPTPLHTAKRARLAPKRPIPRRAQNVHVLVPRSPSSPIFGSLHATRSRLHGATTPRTPAAMWSDAPSMSPVPAPPSILISPPAADIEAHIARSTRSSATMRHEWQFAFMSTLLARDQLAFDRLAWRLDLVFASHACPPEPDDVLLHHPRLVADLARNAARQVITVVCRAWKPVSSSDYAHSPPSFRLSPAPFETFTSAVDAAHAQWAQRASLAEGAEMTERIVLHIVQALWYMVVRDARRSFVRPQLMAQFCTHFLEYVARWNTQESETATRRLPVDRLASVPGAPPRTQPTSAVIRLVFVHALHARFHDIDEHRVVASTAPHLQVPRSARDSHPEGTRMLPAIHADICGVAIIDVARFLGELYRARIIVSHDTVEQWLRLLLLHGAPWAHIPLYELEAACALLLLTGAPTVDRFTHIPFRACSLDEQSDPVQGVTFVQTRVHQQCLVRLEEMLASPLIPDATKHWLRVRRQIFALTSGCGSLRSTRLDIDHSIL